MRRRARGLVAALVGIGALATCATTASDDGVHTLVAVVGGAGAGHRAAGLDSLEALVSGLTAGRVAIDRQPVERCRPPGRCLDALEAGTIDVHLATVDQLSTVFPELQVLEVPYLIEDSAVAALVFSGAFFARVRDALLDRTGLRLMAVSTDGGWRHLANRVREVRTPADAAGLILTTPDVPVQHEMTRALGATPVPPGPADVAGPGSATPGRPGRDPATTPASGTRTSVRALLGMDPAVRPTFLTLDRHHYMTAFWVMHDGAYQALPADLRRLVQLGFDELTRLTVRPPAGEEPAALAAFEARGGRVHIPTPDERRAFVLAGARVSTWFTAEYGFDWLVWLEGAIAEAERTLAVARRPPAGDQP